MSSSIEEIKSRLDVAEVVGNYVKLQKCGANYRACCPFHSEKKPSFFVSPARQIWHCFGCGKGGDVFGFVKEIENVEFGDALKILAQKAGVQLKPMTPETAVWQTQRQRLYEICELASKFFEKQLRESQAGQAANKYLLDRGISQDSINKWRIGYAPDSPRSLTDFLVANKYKMEEINKAGLLVKNEKGDYYDRFRSRIIFPVFDMNSQIVGFGGRIFGPKEKNEIAKYVNTPNTLLYDKSRILYGLDRAKMEIRKKNACILVEGYTDCIMAHQAGDNNVVATSGTALTPFHLRILKRYSDGLITAFDMDVAGNTATKRGIDLAQMMDFNIKVITTPGDKDPADLIARSVPEWKKVISQTRSIFDFYFETAFSRFDKKNPDDKKEISKILLPIIKKIPNKIIQSHWIQKLAKELGVRMEDIEDELKKLKSEIGESLEDFKTQSESPVKSRKQRVEERLISLVFEKPDFLKEITEEDIGLMGDQAAIFVSKLKKFFQDDRDFQKKSFDFLKEISPQELNFINPLILRAEIDKDCAEIDPYDEAKICLEEIRCSDVKDKLGEIAREIKEAEESKDAQKTSNLIKQFNELTKKLNYGQKEKY